MTLKVRDVLGVVSASLPLEKITLVGGGNGQGKSSLLQACAAVALRMPKLRGASRKADFAHVVRRGSADGGAATLSWETGMRRISWPSGDVHSTGDGDARHMGSPLGIGAVRFMELPPKERLSVLAERLDLAPTLDDIAAWLAPKDDRGKPLPEAEEDRQARLDLATALHSKVDISGWDACEKTAREYALKLKGRWEEVARPANWGPQKAATWVPEGLLPDEPYDLAEVAAEMDAAKAAYQAALRAGSASEAEIALAREAAAPLDDLLKAGEACQAAVLAAQETLTALEQRLKDLPRPTDALPLHTCPHCEAEIRVTINAAIDEIRLEKPPAEAAKKASPAENAKRRTAITAARDAIRGAQDALEQARRAAQENSAAVATAEEAKKRLARLQAMPKQDPEAVGRAQLAATQAETKHRLVSTMLRAREIYRDWCAQQPIINCLASTGVRMTVMERRMGAFNAELAALCQVGRFGPVTLTGEGELRYGESSWEQMAESERWRAELLLTLAFAKREGAQLVLVDRLDVLVPTQRPGVCELLIHIGIPALVAMSARNPEALPNLEAANYGRRAWIEGGVLRLL
ncbi:hypothetical protein [Falsiroseomonas tokyonensis]|uniref:Rad50/SbcC-type AAA domain-containing protein n=1 Tax=Falsiroseomonas tokyonensis TaxID=430521 RepID=A0ABV7BXG2_9PROT|nr:hypothetical protein [Falsiroseomonas tokyonensis]MBU8540228.1 hypothetical protein [Falsiroseomonas tokyonensis]